MKRRRLVFLPELWIALLLLLIPYCVLGIIYTIAELLRTHMIASLIVFGAIELFLIFLIIKEGITRRKWKRKVREWQQSQANQMKI